MNYNLKTFDSSHVIISPPIPAAAVHTLFHLSVCVREFAYVCLWRDRFSCSLLLALCVCVYEVLLAGSVGAAVMHRHQRP